MKPINKEMNVYFWVSSPKASCFYPKDRDNELWDQLLSSGTPLPAPDKWYPLVMSEFEMVSTAANRSLPLADVVSGPDFLILNAKSRELFGKVLTTNGAFFPIIIEYGDDTLDEYSIFMCTNIVDCLDYERSKGTRRIRDNSGFSSVHEAVFIEEKVGDNIVFVLPDCPKGQIFVTEQFKQLVKTEGITGVSLTRSLYDLHPWQS